LGHKQFLLGANYQIFTLDMEEENQHKKEHLFVLLQDQQQIQLPKHLQFNLSVNARSTFNEGYYQIQD